MGATRFVGRTSVVTGAAQENARRLAADGGALLAHDVQDASEDIGGVTWLCRDVPDPGSWAAVLEQAGQLDVLVSSARPVGAYETITAIDTRGSGPGGHDEDQERRRYLPHPGHPGEHGPPRFPLATDDSGPGRRHPRPPGRRDADMAGR